MKITSIRQQVKNPERASIFLDGKYSFSLTLNELVAEKLKIGQALDEPSIKRLKKLSDDGKIKSRALEWTMNRPRSGKEFRNYLYHKKADPDLAQRLHEEFDTRGYLSDSKYAVWLTDVRRRGGKSERAIRSELMSKGVAREISEEVLQGNGEELQRLRALVVKKQKLSRYVSDPQKFMMYLVRQGFNFDDIKLVLSETKN